MGSFWKVKFALEMVDLGFDVRSEALSDSIGKGGEFTCVKFGFQS